MNLKEIKTRAKLAWKALKGDRIVGDRSMYLMQPNSRLGWETKLDRHANILSKGSRELTEWYAIRMLQGEQEHGNFDGYITMSLKGADTKTVIDGIRILERRKREAVESKIRSRAEQKVWTEGDKKNIFEFTDPRLDVTYRGLISTRQVIEHGGSLEEYPAFKRMQTDFPLKVLEQVEKEMMERE